MDGDDKVDTTMYEKLYNKAIETRACIVDCDYYVWHSDTGRTIQTQSNNPNDCGQLNNEIVKNLILNTGRLWTKIFKTELIIQNELFFPENLFYEDNAIAGLYYHYAKNLFKVSEPLYYYRTNNTSYA